MSFTKKITSLLMTGLIAIATLFTATGCAGPGAGVSTDPKTINVKMYKAGYGTAWAYELEKKFEQVYADEGYKVNIISPQNDIEGSVVLNELYRGYNATKIDLYITGNLQASDVGSHNSMETNSPLVEDLTEIVYKQPAIGYDGVEESKTIEEKTPEYLRAWIKGDGQHNADGVYYGMPYIDSVMGLVVNTKKLFETYKFPYIPRTTNEYIDFCTKIYGGYNGVQPSEKSGCYPITHFALDGKLGSYAKSWTYAYMAQTDYDEYVQLMNFADADGNERTNDGYETYNLDVVSQGLSFGYFLFDPYLCTGDTRTLDGSQAEIMKSQGINAVFMPNGTWFLNEVKGAYKNYLNDIDIVNYPVSSIVGEELFADRMGKEDADKVLSYIVSLVDQEMEIEEIVQKVQEEMGQTITNDEAQKVAEIRGMYMSRGVESQCLVTKGSTKKDIVALFLRMMASEDCAQTIAEKANSVSIFATTNESQSEYKFVRSVSKLSLNKYASPYRWYSTGLRAKLNKGGEAFTATGDLGKYIYSKNVTMFDYRTGKIKDGSTFENSYGVAAKAEALRNYNDAKNRWANWKETAGL